ncbi:MAG: ATP-binding protein [Pseudomonadota bacterium]|nr:ATP-binding protein [Pseudomonadota bacterium]
MKRFDSITLRVAAVLLLVLLAAQWVAEWLYQEERERVVSHLIAGPLGQRLSMVADKLERTPRPEREDLLQVLNSPRITFTLAAAPLSGTPTGTLRLLQARLSETLGPQRQVVVAGDTEKDGPPTSARIAFTLSDGQVVIAAHHYPNDSALAPSRHLPLLTGYFLVIAVLALLALRWAVHPLQRLAQAADALGRDLGGAPLAETGPREVRQAAHAFNTMQNRLASYLNDRLRILAAVSHDLKTPITRLKLRSEMLADTVQREKFLHDLDDMETMIAATLDFLRGESRQESGVLLDINALLSTLRDDMQALGSTVDLRGEASRPLLARPQALKRCLANLLDNAVRYGRNAGGNAGGGAHITVEDSAKTLTLHIDDNGPGIAESELEHLFEPFRRGETSRNRATGGTGLGLAIARNLARAHGGDVTLTNRPEGGLRATLALPRGGNTG